MGFQSEFNFFNLTGTGRIGFWEDRDFATRLDWALELGFDTESQTGDPQFIDADGLDNASGYATAAVGASIIMDDGDAGFSVVGTWTAKTSATANGGDYVDIAGGGTGANVARWQFTGLTDGDYEIAATWPSDVNGSGNQAVYTLYDGAPTAENGIGRRITTAQSAAPNDFSADGRAWERLGIVRVVGGALTVEVRDAAAVPSPDSSQTRCACSASSATALRTTTSVSRPAPWRSTRATRAATTCASPSRTVVASTSARTGTRSSRRRARHRWCRC